MTNCPNCMAPLEPFQCKCKYCGTWYFDFAAFDFNDNKPCYISMKYGNTRVQFLAQPELNQIETSYDYTDCYDYHMNVVKRFLSGRRCDVGMTFHCLDSINNESHSLIKVVYETEN